MALNLFGRLMPPEESFTALFCEQALRILEAAQELRRMIVDDADIGLHVAAIRDIEMKADVVARKVFIAANRTFNAPIDREDILALAHVLDDAVDLIEDTAKGIARYDVHRLPAEMRAMADAIVDSAERLRKVMPYLDSRHARSQGHLRAVRGDRADRGACRRILRPGPHQPSRAASRGRDRHHRLPRPQGALRARRERRRQVRRHRQRRAVDHRQARLTGQGTQPMDAAALGLPVLDRRSSRSRCCSTS